MALDLGSIALVLGATIYLMFAGTASRTSAMALMFLASATLGFLVVETLDYKLRLATLITGVAATSFGAMLSRKLGSRTAVNAAITGWLGAGAGLFAGTRFYASDTVAIGIDVAFVALAFLLQKTAEKYAPTAEKPAKSAGKSATRGKSGTSGIAITALYAAAVLLIASALLTHADRTTAAKIGQASSAEAEYDAQNGLQTATVEVNGAGFNPRNIDFQPDVMVKLVFRVTSLDAEGMVFASEDLRLEAPLHKGDNIFMLKKPLPGVYGFSVGGKALQGTFTVKASA